MNISSAQTSAPLRSTRALAQAQTPKGGARAVQGSPVPPAATPADPAAVETLEQRLQLFQQGVHERMELLAGQLDGDRAAALDEARSQFDQHVQRLQDGLASGGLDVDQITAGAQATLGLLQGDLSLSLAEPEPFPGRGLAKGHLDRGTEPAAQPTATAAERLEQLQGRLQQRLEAAFQDDPDGLARTSGELRESFARIQGGLASGGLDTRGALQGLQNALANVTRTAQAGPVPVDAQGDVDGDLASVQQPVDVADDVALDDAPEGADARTRFQDFTAQLMERLSQVSVQERGQEAGLADAGQQLESALARIQHAVFEQGGMDRDQMAGLVSQALGGLTAQLAQLFPEPAQPKLYGSQARPEAKLVTKSTLDLSV